MASKTERWLNHLYLYAHIKNQPKVVLSLSEALKIVESQNIVGKADATHVDERWIVQLAALDIKSYRGKAILLFLGIDKDRAEAVYGNIETLNLRTAKKLANEGGAVSAHLVIDLESDVGLHGHHAVLEESEGLSRSRIIPYLRWLFGKFVTFIDTNSDGDEVNVTPYISDEVVLDRPIGVQLKEAKLISVDLYKKAKNSTIDKGVEYYEKTRMIEYRPVSNVFGHAASKIINKILASNPQEEYPEVRVRVAEPGGSERSVGVKRDRQDALMGAFQLRTLVPKLHPPVEEATKTIISHLAKEMIKVLPQKKKG